jgi:hypothetical protein
MHRALRAHPYDAADNTAIIHGVPPSYNQHGRLALIHLNGTHTPCFKALNRFSSSALPRHVPSAPGPV